ncbi:hypothetical protein JOC58_000406 [Paenibacillus hunanensis]|uniref:Uncharacterized protein n=1 Tax=Paenibacillus hunanensis TaxID=539262 RepID=A0ABU1ITC9_9BACL|nr:hypothetical protein [Paenibacillus hunanensis]
MTQERQFYWSINCALICRGCIRAEGGLLKLW